MKTEIENHEVICPCCGESVIYIRMDYDDEYVCSNPDCGMSIRTCWYEKYLAEINSGDK